MRRCLELAIIGAGTVSPNPMVGAVIVHDGRVIGEGYTAPFGGPHAEVNAIHQVLTLFSEQATKLLSQSELYVSLEPCAHFGKTPPCADLIVKYGLRKVYVACKDPFPQVSGKGIEKLRAAGITVETGLLEREARWVNRRFFTRILKHRPFVILKWAQTSDGFIGRTDDVQTWISNPASKQLVHKWRAEEDAILVGTRTALVDNPALTVREWDGHHPRRILIDRNLSVPTSANIYGREGELIVFNAVKSEWKDNVKYIELENFGLYLPQNILYQLYLMDVQSIIIEGGAITIQHFIDAGLWDEARILTAQYEWGSGIAAPKLGGRVLEKYRVANDELSIVVK